MKKIIAAFDGLRFSESTLAFALQAASMEKAKLFGLFLEDPYLHGYGMEELLKKTGGSLSARKRELDRLDAKTRAISIQRFEKACKAEGVDYGIHKEHRFGLEELVEESGFADLLVISSQEAMRPHRKKTPAEFIHNLLPDVKCPVMVVPPKPAPIGKLALLYDGKNAAAFALKMCSNLLSSFSSFPAELITVYADRKKARLPGSRLVKEYLHLHYPDIRVISLEGNTAHALQKYLSGEDNTLVVMGSYNRGYISRRFKPSLADKFMKKLELPLFISHPR
jgi:hypothetical protein